MFSPLVNKFRLGYVVFVSLTSALLRIMQKTIRLKRELEKINKNPPPGISCFPKKDDLTLLDASIIGQVGTPYESGIFKVEVQIPDKYPFQPPCLRFMTRIYHPNIDDQGRICLDLLNLPPKGSWRPTVTVEGLLVALQYLLGNANPDDPLMADIAEEYTLNRQLYEEKAKECTKKFARPSSTEGVPVDSTKSTQSSSKQHIEHEEEHSAKKLKRSTSPQ